MLSHDISVFYIKFIVKTSSEKIVQNQA